MAADAAPDRSVPCPYRVAIIHNRSVGTRHWCVRRNTYPCSLHVCLVYGHEGTPWAQCIAPLQGIVGGPDDPMQVYERPISSALLRMLLCVALYV